MAYAPTKHVEWGVFIALVHMALWSYVLFALLFSSVDEWTDVVWVLPSMAIMTWLYTGLFITAHDAMHGSLSPRHPRLNHGIGLVCTTIYAALPYKTLRAAHHRHHLHVGVDGDPDLVTSAETSLFFEFRRFFLSYLTIRSVGSMVVMSWVLLFVGVRLENMVLFWLIPSLSSAVQLYVVGTWLPHRPGPDLCATHRARGLALSPFWSLIACFHFGYHVEHHSRPHLPWWRLPEARREMQVSALKNVSGPQRPHCVPTAFAYE
jgi:beta-carotene/zeaxanthin 4-ketolase